MKRFVLFFCLILNSFAFAQGFEDSVLVPDDVIERDDSACGLVIDSYISVAEVYINGEYKGRTRLELSDLNPGFYTVRLSKTGYVDVSFSVFLRQGYTNVYKKELFNAKGIISLGYITADCEVYIDGKRYYINPVEISCGSHTVEIKRKGYISYETQVEVKEGRTAYVAVEMVKADEKKDDKIDSGNTTVAMTVGFRGRTENDEFSYSMPVEVSLSRRNNYMNSMQTDYIEASFKTYAANGNGGFPFGLSAGYRHSWYKYQSLEFHLFARYGYSSVKNDFYDGKTGFTGGAGAGFGKLDWNVIYDASVTFAPQSGLFQDMTDFVIKNEISGLYSLNKSLVLKGGISSFNIDAIGLQGSVSISVGQICIEPITDVVFEKEKSPYFCMRIFLSYFF